MSEQGKNRKNAKKDYRETICEKWSNLESKSDIVALINAALKDLYGEDAKQITLRGLNYFAYSKVNAKRYTSFDIPKKDGSSRRIDAPCRGLRTIQRALNNVFQIVYTPHVAAMGFVPERSVATNAQRHVGQRYVYNIDLKDFFPSITSGRVFKRLQSKPFGLQEGVARIITDLCCYENAEHRHVLPQGAPTSPTITNFICERLDIKLSRLAKAYGLNYTRYADDITFSGMNNMFDSDGKFCKSLRHIVEDEEHFTINQKKTRLCHTGMRQEVTGITVNQNTSVSRKYVKQLRTLIHNWEVKGYDEAQAIFISKYNTTKKHNFKGVHHIENVIAGKLLYMKMINGIEDSTYTRLVERFERLLKDIACNTSSSNDKRDKDETEAITHNILDNSSCSISEILDVWEKDGLDAAMALFKKEMNIVNKPQTPTTNPKTSTSRGQILDNLAETYNGPVDDNYNFTKIEDDKKHNEKIDELLSLFGTSILQELRQISFLCNKIVYKAYGLYDPSIDAYYAFYEDHDNYSVSVVSKNGSRITKPISLDFIKEISSSGTILKITKNRIFSIFGKDTKDKIIGHASKRKGLSVIVESEKATGRTVNQQPSDDKKT